MTILDLSTASILVDRIAILLLVTALGSVLVRRLESAVYLLAFQGALLAGAASVVALAKGTEDAFVAAALTLVVKVALVPAVLLHVLSEVRLKREVEAVVSLRVALLIAVALVLVAFYATGPVAIHDGFGGPNVLPVAVSMLLIGLLNTLTRKKALSQVIGLVALENGLYLAAIVTTRGLPLAVELGVAVDLAVGVTIMGLVARQIHRAFDTINTDRLQSLKG